MVAGTTLASVVTDEQVEEILRTCDEEEAEARSSSEVAWLEWLVVWRLEEPRLLASANRLALAEDDVAAEEGASTWRPPTLATCFGGELLCVVVVGLALARLEALATG